MIAVDDLEDENTSSDKLKRISLSPCENEIDRMASLLSTENLSVR